MSLPRLNRQSAGWWVLQDFDATDLFGNDYDETNRPINFAARYGWVTDDDGIPNFLQVADGDGRSTAGPVAGWFCWPGVNGDGMGEGRIAAQWAQIFPAKTASSSTATPLSDAATVDDTLAEIDVAAIDGSTLAENTYGLVLPSTSLAEQIALFVPLGGGGGAANVFWGKVTANNADGTYVYNRTQGGAGASDVDGETGLTATEANLSPYCPEGRYCLFATGVDGNDYFDFTVDDAS